MTPRGYQWGGREEFGIFLFLFLFFSLFLFLFLFLLLNGSDCPEQLPAVAFLLQLQQVHTKMYQPSTESHQTLLPSILRRSFSKQDWRWSRVELLGQCIIGVLEDCTRITAHSEQLAVNEGRKLILHPNFIQHPSTLLLDAFLIWKLKLVKGA